MGEMMDKVKGKMKEAQERLTGDRHRAEEIVEEKKGQVKENVERVKEDIRTPK
jgi:uncharacterized protein YjbJ (UPF0337 family)